MEAPPTAFVADLPIPPRFSISGSKAVLTLKSPIAASFCSPPSTRRTSTLSTEDRRGSVMALSQLLLDDIVSTLVSRRSRRIGEHILGERWEGILTRAERTREYLVRGISRGIVDDLLRESVSRETRRVAVLVRREEELMGWAFRLWRDRTRESEVARQHARVQARNFRKLVRDIPVGVADDEVIGEIDFEGLSIGGVGTEIDDDRLIEKQMADVRIIRLIIIGL